MNFNFLIFSYLKFKKKLIKFLKIMLKTSTTVLYFVNLRNTKIYYEIS